ncbi:anthranilate phosphoribosyltransferase [Elysia marginata]|uniref:Anthranilate phosphoribosyltransferase n=1 Tax=Elysia marginata TaxID=1093978 RepID=A0AAV4EZX1_9GAST|nr:anthranilate phosphoribosyltransferase [Elysia marginata]
MRPISLDELEGFRDALLELCIGVDFSDYDPIDLCGTGGDGKNTFNISTLSSFVVAGAGIPVAKHGNYGVSSSCGSSNVLEFLGVKFTTDKDFLSRTMDTLNIAILHAPLFHPAMKFVAPLRRELGVKTFFNMLGPMVNPCFPKKQVVGVFNLELARIYSYLYQRRGDCEYSIIYDFGGFDEVSLTQGVKVFSKDKEFIFDPTDHFSKISEEDIKGGDSVEESAKIFLQILKGEGTKAQNDVVFSNSGLAIATAKKVSLEEGICIARESLESGKALRVLERLQKLSISKIQ